MTIKQNCIIVLFILIVSNAVATEQYLPGTGDTSLDSALIQINRQIENRIKDFSSVLSEEFQVPEEKVTGLFRHYEFTPADVLMTLSIADISGQPVDIVSRAYFENKSSGWAYTLEYLKIKKGSSSFEQIKQDAMKKY